MDTKGNIISNSKMDGLPPEADQNDENMCQDVMEIIEKLDVSKIDKTPELEDSDSNHSGNSQDSKNSNNNSTEVFSDDGNKPRLAQVEIKTADHKSRNENVHRLNLTDDIKASEIIVPPGGKLKSSQTANLIKPENMNLSTQVKNCEQRKKKTLWEKLTSSKESAKKESRDEPTTKGRTYLKKLEKALSSVTVDHLPQVFITKYMGARPCSGLWGIKHTRGPVEQLVASVNKMEKGGDLPLVQLQISPSGIQVSAHKQNKGKSVERELIPIEFISYGVQDIKFGRIFSFIMVKEMATSYKKMECHAYVCDSVVTARRIALSLAMAFKEYAKTLHGKPHKFGVDLRSTAELHEDLSASTEQEFEA